MGKIVPIDEVRFIFNPAVLEKGDILLMNTYEERLREKLGCKYEHAAIYVGDAYIMEANGLHVVMSHIYSYAFREVDHACVLRLKKYSPRALEEVARNARKQMGRDYVNTNQFRYVRALKNSDKKDSSNNSFCSSVGKHLILYALIIFTSLLYYSLLQFLPSAKANGIPYLIFFEKNVLL